jgi:deoxyribodipyrimidine photo-lyase
MKRALFWFRRDLRAYDNAGLSAALTAAEAVHCVFVFDREILDALADRRDRRVEFIWHSVNELADRLAALGGALHILHGRAREEIPALAARLDVSAVFTNSDYEPAAVARDAQVAATLARDGRALLDHKDQVIFERAEVLTLAGTPFSVFTPYRNAWLKRLPAERLNPWPVEKLAARLAPGPATVAPSLAELGFAATNLLAIGVRTGSSGAQAVLQDFLIRIAHYHELRDFPGRKGVSYLSVHLRFGTLSIRELVRHALADGGPGANGWLNELIWRDFYFQILHHYPHSVTGAFKREYDALAFDNDPDLLAAWQDGRTGYPMVDAAMRQLAQTGFMHNRLRMISASFLVKDLLVDWRLGEAWFARHLNDFDLSANNGGWQWAASTGCDAQPYFRIFNPVSQSERFDPDGRFIRRYVPELAGVPDRWVHAPWTMPPLEQAAAGVRLPHDYPAPVVDHASARLRSLALYKAARTV